MKLIIDIDDEQVLFDIKNRGLEAETETDKAIINALYNGIPLDNIKAEIQENINYNKRMNYQGIVAGLLLTLNIIDQYIGKENEDKE